MRSLQLESSVTLHAGAFRVVELRTAKLTSAEGELPFIPVPATKRFCTDLAGPSSYFATIDWGDGSTPSELFVGFQVAESQLKLIDQTDFALRDSPFSELRCPNCAATLRLHAGHRTERIACEHCLAVFDSQSLKLIPCQQQKTASAPLLALGSIGRLQETDFTVVAYVLSSREINPEGRVWHEYLLFAPTVGFRWLIDCGHAWLWASQQNLADLDLADFPSSIRQKGRTFRLRASDVARRAFVLGEFYWKLQPGQTLQCSDYEFGSDLIFREANETCVCWWYAQPLEFPCIAEAFNLPVDSQSSPSRTSLPTFIEGRTTLFAKFVLVMVVLLLASAAAWFGISLSAGH
jgi:hypothetical protein